MLGSEINIVVLIYYLLTKKGVKFWLFAVEYIKKTSDKNKKINELKRL